MIEQKNTNEAGGHVKSGTIQDWAAYAGQLETELDEAKAEIAAMRKAMQVAVDAIEGWYK